MQTISDVARRVVDEYGVWLRQPGLNYPHEKLANAITDLDSVLRNAAPPRAGTWRLLDVGECIEKGDEYWSCREIIWISADERANDNECVVDDLEMFRRRLPAQGGE